MEVAMVWKV